MLHRMSGCTTKGLLGTFQLGDSFQLDRGFTLVWVGWEFDVPPAENPLHLYAPVATNDSQPIFGLVQSEWIGDKSDATQSSHF